jgi:hypothetical protein
VAEEALRDLLESYSDLLEENEQQGRQLLAAHQRVDELEAELDAVLSEGPGN